MTEEKYLRIMCRSLKVLAWFLLIFGILSCVVITAILIPFAVINRMSGVAVLFFFILIFLFIHLVVKIAEMVFEIKQKTVI